MPINELNIGTEKLNSIIISKCGKQIATGLDDKTIKIWDINSKKCLKTLKGHSDRITSIVYS